MDTNEHNKAGKLFKYAFMWNQVRLVVAALSLIFGGFPIVLRIFSSSGMISSLLSISQIISGLAAGYMLFLWLQSGKKLWGGNDKIDVAAFWIAVISGLHLGIAGLIGTNIGMAVIPGVFLTTLMLLAGALYIFSAWHLYNRSKSGDMFSHVLKPKTHSAPEAREHTSTESE